MLGEIISCLPPVISEKLLSYDLSEINEIRLVSSRPCTVVMGERTLLLGVTVSERELNETLYKLTGNSLHAYEETLSNGYLPLANGVRAGVCGRVSGGRLLSVSSICLRIPRTVSGIGASLCKRLLTGHGGMLIYSPPGIGKTTLLRDVASTLSSSPYLKRVSVIDSRGEIYRPDAFSRSIADIYTGYRKADGIELAVRTMSPQFIFCDELGRDEAEAVLATLSFGVPLVATAHAPSLNALLSRKVFASLDEFGVFSLYVGLSRQGRGFTFDITEREGNI